MIHHMNLNDKPFYNIINGSKRIELRLYDKKRKSISINDTIIFHRVLDENETVSVKVIGLLIYNSFEELFNDIDYNISGPANTLNEKLENIHKIYSYEDEEKFGILGIRLKKM